MTITQEQFTEIYNSHVEKIYRFCFLKISSSDDAKDLTSEVFVKFIHYAKKNDREVENIRAFLYRIARNLVIDYYRVREKKPLPLEEDLLGEGEVPQLASPEKALMENSDMEGIQDALKKIHDDYADLIIWHYLEDLSIPEISQINGKSDGANRVGLHRALKALREEIEVS